MPYSVKAISPISDLKTVLYEYISPLEKFVKMTDIQKEVDPDMVYPILNVDTWTSRHQTVAIFQVCADSNHILVERATRMATCFNTAETIKVDIMSLVDSDFYEGLVFTGKVPGGLSYETLCVQVKKWGYNQMFLHTFTGPI